MIQDDLIRKLAKQRWTNEIKQQDIQEEFYLTH